MKTTRRLEAAVTSNRPESRWDGDRFMGHRCLDGKCKVVTPVSLSNASKEFGRQLVSQLDRVLTQVDEYVTDLTVDERSSKEKDAFTKKTAANMNVSPR